jgi:pyruvate/2-oxoglutarate dehydrogenase complex dihydrolipoamide acyltransferase (E2) component
MDVVMPQLGETVAEGKVAAWFKTLGDKVEAGEDLFEIETDKVTMEVQALTGGILSEIRVRAGEVAPVGAVVAVIGESGAARAPSPLAGEGREGGKTPPKSPSSFTGGAPRRSNGTRPSFTLAPFAETNTPTQNYGKATGAHGLKITPLARRLIAQHSIDLSLVARQVKARGGWRVSRADIETLLADGAGHPSLLPGSPPQEGRERIAFSAIRRQTAERLAESWRTIPHVFQAVEVDFGAVEKVRQARKAGFQARHGVSLTYLPFIARAVCIAISAFPRVNARLDGDGLALASDVNLGIAVDLSHEGLVVPVLKHADELATGRLAKAIARLVGRARSKALGPDDFAGATYTITNNGSFGTLFTAPIINPPQVAILSTDAIRKKPVVVESESGDSIAIRPIGVVAQSFDHRAFDGAYSAAFLQRLKAVLETHDWTAEIEID